MTLRVDRIKRITTEEDLEQLANLVDRLRLEIEVMKVEMTVLKERLGLIEGLETREIVPGILVSKKGLEIKARTEAEGYVI